MHGAPSPGRRGAAAHVAEGVVDEGLVRGEGHVPRPRRPAARGQKSTWLPHSRRRRGRRRHRACRAPSLRMRAVGWVIMSERRRRRRRRLRPAPRYHEADAVLVDWVHFASAPRAVAFPAARCARAIVGWPFGGGSGERRRWEAGAIRRKAEGR